MLTFSSPKVVTTSSTNAVNIGARPASSSALSIPLRKPASNAVLVATLAATLMAAGCRRKSRYHRRQAKNESSADDVDSLLMEAGLQEVLGSELKNIEAMIEEQCKVSDDFERCLNDTEVKNKVLLEELAVLRERLGLKEVRLLGTEVAKLTKELAEAKGVIKHLQGSGSDKWAERKVVEDARDAALVSLEATKKKAEADGLAAAERLKSAQNQTKVAEAELKAIKAELEALKS